MELNKFFTEIHHELKPYIKGAFTMAEEAGDIVESIRTDRNHSILASNPSLLASMRQILSNKTI